MTAPSDPTAPAPPASDRRSPAWTILLVVAVIVIVGSVAAIVLHDDTSSTSTDSSGPAPVLTASLAAPDGWHANEDGTVVARDAADLTAESPTGPRATLQLDPVAITPEDVIAADADGASDVGDPDEIQIDGHDAVAVTITESTGGRKVTTTYVSGRTSDGHAALFILEAPAADADGLEDTLMAIPRLAG